MAKIGDRIAYLRKTKSLSQTDLAKSISASREAIGKYERNEAMPSVETAKKIADVFEVTLDYLVDETAAATLDKQTVKRILDIEKLSQEDKQNIFYTLDNLIKAAKLKTI